MCHNVIFKEQIGSTNDYALDLIHKKKAKHKDLIWTKNQNNGRGLSGNSWYSEANKNLTLSIIFNTTFLHAEHQFFLNKAISLAVFDFVNEQLNTNSIYIKWPNDVIVKKRKIAGILIQHIVLGNWLQWSIIGIGVNINQKTFSKKLKNAVSLTMLTKEIYDLEECLQSLSNKIYKRFNDFRNSSFDLISEEYKLHLYQENKWCPFKSSGEQWVGRILDVNKYGQLIVEKEDSSKSVFNMKEIEFL